MAVMIRRYGVDIGNLTSCASCLPTGESKPQALQWAHFARALNS